MRARREGSGEVDEEPPGRGPAHWKFGTTADVGIGARASTPQELFAQLGLGFTDLVSDRSKVSPVETREVVAHAKTLEGLVVDFLTDLIELFDEEGFLCSRIEIALEGSPPETLRGRLQGELYDPKRHPIHVQVKAVTLHRLQIDLSKGRARVIVDI
ncbi:MAG: archease [Euryarchaeota archaeon]|nr:archease [Euryarchaeota archaeon]MDE1837281.1 archease [Euryarchaeota archaeon]MDE1879951.1 archease [Euryarchaeota archaeon]MDE2045115.1 archease [Thermoplasmata archaeon]